MLTAKLLPTVTEKPKLASPDDPIILKPEKPVAGASMPATIPVPTSVPPFPGIPGMTAAV